MRLDRFLANSGMGSRQEVRRLLGSGGVTVNGVTERDGATQVNPAADRVVCRGETIVYHTFVYLMLNKPAGIVSATRDPGQQTVLDLLERKYRNKEIFPVGRLDKDTEGLLLLTNDGPLGHRLLAPKRHVAKIYCAMVTGAVDGEDIRAFRQGVLLEDGYRTLPAELVIIQPGEPSLVEVTIHEGKYHQIKRMFGARGKRVLQLQRVAMGELVLDPALKPGEYRELTDEELAALQGSFQ